MGGTKQTWKLKKKHYSDASTYLHVYAVLNDLLCNFLFFFRSKFRITKILFITNSEHFEDAVIR